MGGLLKLRIEPGDASEIWRRSEGRAVDGKFQLLSYLAGSEDSAVFLTSTRIDGGAQEAVIKLIYAGTVDVEKQLLRWEASRGLSHPNLLRVFDSGRCEIDGMQLLYVVQEYAEENLAQILPERALTPAETAEMLPTVLGALKYLHENGFAHGHLQPSNVLAKGDQLKLSSDSLVPVGEKSARARAGSVYDPPEAESDKVLAASDIWRLGITLIEVLTQQLPAWDRARTKSPEIPRGMAEPFRDMSKHCLLAEPEKRWGITQIVNRLEPESTRAGLESTTLALSLVQNESIPTEKRPSGASLPKDASPVVSERQKAPAKWPYLVIVAAAVVVVVALIVRPKTPAPTSAVQSAEQQSAGIPVQPVITQSQPSVSGSATGNSADQDGVVHRVVPQVLPSARRSIHGRIVVRVKVNVDAAGDVAKATVVSGHVSKYFSRLALEAARDWKFAAATNGAASDRQWMLQFAFTRANTDVSAKASNR